MHAGNKSVPRSPEEQSESFSQQCKGKVGAAITVCWLLPRCSRFRNLQQLPLRVLLLLPGTSYSATLCLRGNIFVVRNSLIGQQACHNHTQPDKVTSNGQRVHFVHDARVLIEEIQTTMTLTCPSPSRTGRFSSAVPQTGPVARSR